MSIQDNHSHGGNVCAKPFSPMGLVIIGVLVLVSIVLWQHGPSVGTLVLLPLMLICPLIAFESIDYRPIVHVPSHKSGLGSLADSRKAALRSKRNTKPSTGRKRTAIRRMTLACVISTIRKKPLTGVWPRTDDGRRTWQRPH